VHGNLLYAVGGGYTCNSVEAINIAAPSSHTRWKLVPGEMAVERDGHASAVYKGNLYVIGGYDDDSTVLRSVEVYDFAMQQWSLLPVEMPTARSGHGAVCLSDKLYVIGGGGSPTSPYLSMDVYNFVTTQWSHLNSGVLQDRCGITNSVVHAAGNIYVMAGGWQNAVAFHVASGVWRLLPVQTPPPQWTTLPTATCCAAVAHRGKIYVLGGEVEGEFAFTASNAISVYDVAAETWSVMPSQMRVPRAGFGAVVHGETMYAVGGSSMLACQSMEVLSLAALLAWTPARHVSFPKSFREAVCTLMMCVACTDTLHDDLVCKILWFLDRDGFSTVHKAVL
jgi:N-acetylneuraminic acid mutarotase